jgi:hypothetical protein
MWLLLTHLPWHTVQGDFIIKQTQNNYQNGEQLPVSQKQPDQIVIKDSELPRRRLSRDKLIVYMIDFKGQHSCSENLKTFIKSNNKIYNVNISSESLFFFKISLNFAISSKAW